MSDLRKQIEECERERRKLITVPVCVRKKGEKLYYYTRRKVNGRISEHIISEEEYQEFNDNNLKKILYGKKIELLKRKLDGFCDNSNKSRIISCEILEIQKKLSQKPLPQFLEENDGRIYTTRRGEKVRSKSEVIIADALYSMGIYYEYEKPLLKGKYYPDFTIEFSPRGETLYIEHFGMLSSPEYVYQNLLKLIEYEKNGIISGHNLILTYEYYRPVPEKKIVEQICFDSSVIDQVIKRDILPLSL